MGYTTDFIGHIDIQPARGEAEQVYLSAFADSRRWARPGGPYEVPGNPKAEGADRGPVPDAYNHTASGQPGLWCGWQPCWGGCCLSFDGHEKFYAPVPWMVYLIDHFIRPDALASTSGLDCFRDFTFDHRADGLIAGCRRDNKELVLIRVDDNVVREEILRTADPRYGDWPPLPYEAEIDRWDAERTKRRRRGPKSTG